MTEEDLLTRAMAERDRHRADLDDARRKIEVLERNSPQPYVEMLEAEIVKLKEIVKSLAARAVGQSDLLTELAMKGQKK